MKQEYSEDAAYHFDLTQAQRTNVLGDATWEDYWAEWLKDNRGKLTAPKLALG